LGQDFVAGSSTELLAAQLHTPAIGTTKRAGDFPISESETLWCMGTQPFVEDVTKALSVLAEGYPYGYSLVQRYVHAIEPEGFSEGGETFSPAALGSFGALAEKTTSQGRLPVPAERYAAFLVRIAANHKCARLHAPRSQRADLLAKKEKNTP
jgi:hypothetical protein